MGDQRLPAVELQHGADMPVFGLGTWLLSSEDAADSIAHALGLGYRLIDTACDYGSEEPIRRAIADSSIPREELFLISKVEEDEDSHAATRERAEALGVEQLDLCLVHRPPPDGPGEALWEGLLEARAEGLTREIGVSNYSAEQIDRLIEVTGETPAVNQIEWSPFGWSDELLQHARRAGVVVQAYSPLTRGERLDDPALEEVAAAHRKTAAQVLLRWDLQLGVTVVPKAADTDHQRENLAIFDFELNEQEMERLAALNAHYSSLGGLPYV